MRQIEKPENKLIYPTQIREKQKGIRVLESPERSGPRREEENMHAARLAITGHKQNKKLQWFAVCMNRNKEIQ